MVVTNSNSGNCINYTDEELKNILERDFEFIRVDIDEDFSKKAEENACNSLVVVGGDGTLNSILNKIRKTTLNVFYIPKGTLNEKAKTVKKFDSNENLVIGKANGNIFTYVAACGTFTPIGYATKTKNKKRFKLLAYFFQALKEYKVNDIKVDMSIDGKDYSDDYTLIMFLKSPRCFIFNFNKLYSPHSNYGHVLLINSPGENTFKNKIKIFFPLFRAFFIGFRKPIEKDNLKFLQFKRVDLKLYEDTAFAFDGEKRVLSNDVKITMTPLKPNLTVCSPKRKIGK